MDTNPPPGEGYAVPKWAVMVQAIVVPTNIDKPIRLEQLNQADLDAYRRIVGGNLEAIELESPRGAIYFNAEGKLEDLPVNPRLSTLLYAHNTDFRMEDVIVGPGLIVGPPDANGDDQDAPAELVELLFHTKQYRTQLKMQNYFGWFTGTELYDNWGAAYRFVVGLAIRWPAVTGVRVVPELEPELRDAWFEIGRTTPPLHDAVDPEFTPDSFTGCFSLQELRERFEHGNWSLGTSFYYKDLCFICRVDGADEWLTIRHGVAFESISFMPIIEHGEFDSLIARLLAATKEQCLRLEY